jgi:lipopolysaccharide/colanic/teichoic acid biosynthesis glycosyltransferase
VKKPAPGGEGVPRWFDLIAATLGWVVLAPLLALIGLIIRFDAPGPALFRQVRIGRCGRPFVVYKFRTMRVSDASASISAADEIDFERFVFTPARPDPRITAIGRALRQTSLDELPQLLNVIRGDMALIGPRPEIPELVRVYPPEFHQRHAVRPGVTGLAQVSGRSDLTYAKTIRYDLAYVRRRSPRHDLAILARTVGAVLLGTGAR